MKFYDLPDLNPTYWSEDPADANQEAGDDDHNGRYSALVADSARMMGFYDERVPMDEPDPLDRLDSVIESKGLDPSQMSSKERAPVMVSSKAFNAKTFLLKVHDDATFDDLLRGSDRLRASLEQRSEALKILVEQNFDRFVSAKATIDMVYQEMQAKTLNKQADYGVGDLKNILTNATNKADKVFGPVLENRAKADKIRSTVSILAKYKFFFDLPSSLRGSLRKNKFDTAMHDYKRGKYLFQSIVDDAAIAASGAIATDRNSTRSTTTVGTAAVSNEQLAALTEQQRKVFDKVWGEAERIMGDMQQTLFERLIDPDRTSDEQEKTMDILLELETPDDPVWFYLDNQYTYVVDLLKSTFKDQTAQLEIISAACKQDADDEKHAAVSLRNAIKHVNSRDFESLMEDESDVQMWKATLEMVKVMTTMMLRCLPDLNKMSKAYIEGKFTKTSTTNLMAARRKRMGLDKRNVERCARMPRDILDLFASLLSKYFTVDAGQPPVPATPAGGDDVAMPSFVPANANAITTSYFIIKIVQDLTECVGEVNVLQLGTESMSSLTKLMDKMRWRAVEALCATWARDSKTIYVIEDWTLDPDNKEITIFLRHFYFFHKYCSRTAFKIASLAAVPVTNREGKPGLAKIPKDYLEKIKATFLDSLYKFLDGMVHLALSEEEQQKPIDTRILLSVSNLSNLKAQLIGRMVNNFENAWKISMTEDMKVLMDIVNELDELLFAEFIKQKADAVATLIRNGILHSGIDWAHIAKPTEVQAYVYDALLALVIAHSQVNDVAKALISRTMSTLLEKLAAECLASFKAVETKFGMGGMLQATLEIEFIHQTLGQYASATAQKTFQDIYATIQRRYEPARGENGDFQAELETVKKLLVACRKGTSLQFLCFKQPKGARQSTR